MNTSKEGFFEASPLAEDDEDSDMMMLEAAEEIASCLESTSYDIIQETMSEAG